MSKKQRNSLEVQDSIKRRSFIIQAVAASFFLVLPLKTTIMNNPPGVTVRKSKYSVKETTDRLQTALEQHNVTIYARINQQDELKKVGQVIPPLEFLLFGNPKAGGPAMADNPMAALDLPLKVIAWQDERQIVQVAYNDFSYIQKRYSLTESVAAPFNLEPLLSKILS